MRTLTGWRMMLGGAVALMLGLLGVTTQGPTAAPIAANAEYRLVPVARTQPDTTRWHVERRVMHDAGGTWGLQVMVVTRAGRTSWDSVRFDPVTLALVWERSFGPPATVITVAGSRLEGRLGTTEGPRPFAAEASGPVYSSTMDDFVIQRLPLAEGSPRVLAFWDGSRLERDTVRVRESGAKGWVVDFAEPYAVGSQIPVCLWFLARDRKNGRFRDRRGQVLFVDARKLGKMVDRTHRELTDEDIARIAGTYQAWRGEKGAGEYADVAGFCRSATLEEIRKHEYVLTPGRYVGAEAQEDDGEPFEEKMRRLVATLREQQAEAAKMDAVIAANLKELGYGG